jgi:hypothetical protein
MRGRRKQLSDLKQKDTRYKIKYLKLFAKVISIMIFFVVIAISSFYIYSTRGCIEMFWSDQDFNKGEWTVSPHTERYVYANDLISNKVIGLNYDEIVLLLGKPDSVSKLYNHVDYVIKRFPNDECLFTSIAFIRIEMGEDGKARNAYIAYD